MESAQKFIALRDALQAQCDPLFSHTQNIELCNRMVALHSTVCIRTKAKILGVIETKGTVYSTEQRVLVLVPELTAETLEDWYNYGKQLMDELIVPKDGHQFSMMSLLLVCPAISPKVGRSLKRLCYDPKYQDGLFGWASLRLAAADLSSDKVYTNRIGAPLANILKTALQAAENN